MFLTKSDAIQGHREMWNWIAEQCEQGATERAWLKIKYCKDHKVDLAHNCFCCDYGLDGDEYNVCFNKFCPLVWPGEDKFKSDGYACEGTWNEGDDESTMGLWLKWKRTVDPHEAAEIARQIANLPERI